MPGASWFLRAPPRAGIRLESRNGVFKLIPCATKEADFVLSPAFFAGWVRTSRHDSVVAEIVSTGGRSSMVELQIVVLAVAGSSPVGRPASFTSEEIFNGKLWYQIGASCNGLNTAKL